MKQVASIIKSVAQELRFMLILCLAIICILAIGFFVQFQQHPSTSLLPTSNPIAIQRQRLAAYPRELTALESALFLVGVEPVVSKYPWEMSSTDLTSQRVVYNVATKPGFQLLSLQLIATLIGIALFLRITKVIILLPAKVYRRLSGRLGRLAGNIDVQTIYGTVHITAKSGVIYISGSASALVQEIEDFGLWLGIPRITISTT